MANFVPTWVGKDPNIAGMSLMTSATLAQQGATLVYPVVQSNMYLGAQDPSLGWGLFIYAQVTAAAGVAAGDWCELTGQTLAIGASIINVSGVQKWQGTVNSGKPLCIALAAGVQNAFGWFQVYGAALVNSNGAIAAGNSASWQANGVIQAAGVASKQALNAMAVVANSTNFGQVVSGAVTSLPATQSIYFINSPFAQGNIT